MTLGFDNVARTAGLLCFESRIAEARPIRHFSCMKILVLAALFVATFSLQAQVGTSPRTLVRRIAPQLPPQQPVARPGGAAGATAPAAAATPPSAADIEEKQAELSIEEKKKLQWQMDRAEKGSDPAQYTIGMRYLEGKGVPKDLKKARKWLTESAKQGNADAKKTLAEHPELPPLDDPKIAKPATAAAPATPTAAPPATVKKS